MITASLQGVEMFLAVITGILLVWWKLRQTVAYLANHPPALMLPRPREPRRKVSPVPEDGWRAALAPFDYRDDSEAAG